MLFIGFTCDWCSKEEKVLTLLSRAELHALPEKTNRSKVGTLFVEPSIPRNWREKEEGMVYCSRKCDDEATVSSIRNHPWGKVEEPAAPLPHATEGDIIAFLKTEGEFALYFRHDASRDELLCRWKGKIGDWGEHMPALLENGAYLVVDWETKKHQLQIPSEEASETAIQHRKLLEKSETQE